MKAEKKGEEHKGDESDGMDDYQMGKWEYYSLLLLLCVRKSEFWQCKTTSL